MSIPSIIYGDYGDEKVTSSTKIGNLPLGQLMILPDGRKYRHAKSGGTTLIVGSVLRQGMIADTVMDQDVVSYAGGALGALSITLTMGGTATVANYYADGYLYTSLSAGVGSVYKIASHGAVGTDTEELEFTLADHDEIALAIDAGSTKAGLRQNEYGSCLLNPSATNAFKGIICGIAPVAVPADYYFWCQRSGVAVGQSASNSCLIGEGVSASSAEAGSIEVCSTADGELNDVIGHSMVIGAGGTYVLIHLELE